MRSYEYIFTNEYTKSNFRLNLSMGRSAQSVLTSAILFPMIVRSRRSPPHIPTECASKSLF
jgi:hypothetical protein